METLFDILSSPLIWVLEIVSFLIPVSLLVHMHYDAKYRNKTLSVAWYIFGFLSPFITMIVYMVKRKKFPTPETRICPQCGNEYPEGFTMCNRCLIQLPEHDMGVKDKQKKIAAATFLIFWIVYVITTVSGGYVAGTVVKDSLDLLDTLGGYGRIGIVTETGDKVYYDKMGNTYDDPYGVVIYGEDGTKYTYVEEEGAYDLLSYYYVSEDGTKYESGDCYVNEDGWFVYDENYEFICSDWLEDDEDYESDNESNDEYLNEEDVWGEDYDMKDFYSDMLDEAASYRYYELPYYDNDGNVYYWAEEASWNEKGELITAENDPTVE